MTTNNPNNIGGKSNIPSTPQDLSAKPRETIDTVKIDVVSAKTAYTEIFKHAREESQGYFDDFTDKYTSTLNAFTQKFTDASKSAFDSSIDTLNSMVEQFNSSLTKSVDSFEGQFIESLNNLKTQTDTTLKDISGMYSSTYSDIYSALEDSHKEYSSGILAREKETLESIKSMYDNSDLSYSIDQNVNRTVTTTYVDAVNNATGQIGTSTDLGYINNLNQTLESLNSLLEEDITENLTAFSDSLKQINEDQGLDNFKELNSLIFDSTLNLQSFSDTLENISSSDAISRLQNVNIPIETPPTVLDFSDIFSNITDENPLPVKIVLPLPVPVEIKEQSQLLGAQQTGEQEVNVVGNDSILNTLVEIRNLLSGDETTAQGGRSKRSSENNKEEEKKSEKTLYIEELQKLYEKNDEDAVKNRSDYFMGVIQSGVKSQFNPEPGERDKQINDLRSALVSSVRESYANARPGDLQSMFLSQAHYTVNTNSIYDVGAAMRNAVTNLSNTGLRNVENNLTGRLNARLDALIADHQQDLDNTIKSILDDNKKYATDVDKFAAIEEARNASFTHIGEQLGTHINAFNAAIGLLTAALTLAGSWIGIYIDRFKQGSDNIFNKFEQTFSNVAVKLDQTAGNYIDWQNNTVAALQEQGLQNNIAISQVMDTLNTLLSKGLSEEDAKNKAISDNIARVIAPAIDTQSEAYIDMQQYLGMEFVKPLLGMEGAIRDNVGQSRIFNSTIKTVVEKLEPISIYAKEQNAAGMAEMLASLEQSGLTHQDAVNVVNTTLGIMDDPYGALTGGNVTNAVTAATIAANGGDYGDILGTASSLLGTMNTFMSGTSQVGQLGQSAVASSVNLPVSWRAREALEDWASRGGFHSAGEFTNDTLVNKLDELNQNLANDKYTTAKSQSEIEWENNATYVTTLRETYPDAYAMLGNITNVLWMIFGAISVNVIGNLFGGFGNLLRGIGSRLVGQTVVNGIVANAGATAVETAATTGASALTGAAGTAGASATTGAVSGAVGTAGTATGATGAVTGGATTAGTAGVAGIASTVGLGLAGAAGIAGGIYYANDSKQGAQGTESGNERAGAALGIAGGAAAAIGAMAAVPVVGWIGAAVAGVGLAIGAVSKHFKELDTSGAELTERFTEVTNAIETENAAIYENVNQKKEEYKKATTRGEQERIIADLGIATIEEAQNMSLQQLDDLGNAYQRHMERLKNDNWFFNLLEQIKNCVTSFFNPINWIDAIFTGNWGNVFNWETDRDKEKRKWIEKGTNEDKIAASENLFNMITDLEGQGKVDSVNQIKYDLKRDYQINGWDLRSQEALLSAIKRGHGRLTWDQVNKFAEGANYDTSKFKEQPDMELYGQAGEAYYALDDYKNHGYTGVNPEEYKRNYDILKEIDPSNVSGFKSPEELSVPKYKLGLDYVPYDDMLASLHEGERVLTKEENKAYTYAIEASVRADNTDPFISIIEKMSNFITGNGWNNDYEVMVNDFLNVTLESMKLDHIESVLKGWNPKIEEAVNSAVSINESPYAPLIDQMNQISNDTSLKLSDVASSAVASTVSAPTFSTASDYLNDMYPSSRDRKARDTELESEESAIVSTMKESTDRIVSAIENKEFSVNNESNQSVDEILFGVERRNAMLNPNGSVTPSQEIDNLVNLRPSLKI